MGIFDIPPDPTGAGKLTIEVDLNREELEQAVAFFRAANQALQRGEGGPQPVSAGSLLAPAPDFAVGGRAQWPPVVYEEAEGNVRNECNLVEGAGGSHESGQMKVMQQAMEKVTVTGPPAERAPMPITLPQLGGLVSNRLEHPQSHTLPTDQSQQPSFESAENPFSRWELIWKSDPSDHNCSEVQSMAYCAEIPGLPASEDGSGWVVSSSPKLLNLWGANRRGSVGDEPCLQLLHSQEVAYNSIDLAAAPSLSTMFIAMVEDSTNQSYVSMHSLSPEAMLAPKGQYTIPTTQNFPALGTAFAHRVVSLYNLGKPLQNGFAVAYGKRIAIWGRSRPDKGKEVPLADFAAHAQPVSALCLSTNKPVLFSGSSGGEVALWSLQGPPSKPIQTIQHHKKLISGVEQVEQHMVLTSSLDGNVTIWDLRSTDRPLKATAPDGSGIHKASVSPIGDCIMLGTAQNLYAMNLVDLDAEIVPVVKNPMTNPYSNIVWNRQTLEVYAASSDGSISTFRNMA